MIASVASMWRRRFSLATRASTSATTCSRAGGAHRRAAARPRSGRRWRRRTRPCCVRGTCDLLGRRDDGDLVLVRADADALGEDVVEHEQVDALGGLLVARPLQLRARPRRRSRRGRGPGSRRLGEDVDSAHELERRASRASPRSILPSSRVARRKSATAAAMTSTSASPTCSRTAAAISSALSTRHDVVRRAVRGLRRDEHDAGAAQVGLVGHRAAHLAARAVADEAHRVDALARAAGGDDDLACRRAARRRCRRRRGARRGGWPRARPCGRSPLRRRPARPRSVGQHLDAALGEHAQVLDGGGMLVHGPVHRRRHDDRAAKGEVDGGEQVVGHAGGHLGERVGGRRGDDHHARLPGRLDVLEPAAARLPGALVVEHRRLRDRREGERHDEALRGLGAHDQRLEAVLDEPAHQLDGLVDGDAAGDADEDGAARRPARRADDAHGAAQSGVSYSILSSTISSKAMVRRLVLRVLMSGGVSLLDAHRVLAEAVVVAVDLARALGGDHDQRVARAAGVRQELVDAGLVHLASLSSVFDDGGDLGRPLVRRRR